MKAADSTALIAVACTDCIFNPNPAVHDCLCFQSVRLLESIFFSV